MNYDLFNYQRKAAADCLARLIQARDNWTNHKTPSSFALSAITGAGKTVIATAVIEAMLHGSADFDIAADPRAVFLWVTDDPALNRQTRNKMLDASDVITPGSLRELNDSFTDPILDPGNVYFLNIQQLASSSSFAKSGTNGREHSGWDIIASTIKADDRDLYVVLDEAHRGMSPDKNRPTIVRQIIGGRAGANPPAPVVWGISATIDRFSKEMKDHQDTRNQLVPVAVDSELVRDAGIIKDEIVLDQPNETGEFFATLLRAAVDSLREFETRWAAYAESSQTQPVVPAMVVQVADEPSDAHLAEIVNVIEDQWGSPLPASAVVNVFGTHTDLKVGKRTVKYVAPETIADDDRIRVVLAKTAISTGWDCPRAEVLFSERRAVDATNIAQVIGRMVRSPLARRIVTDDALNAVTCFLPRFERDALDAIVAEITKPGEPGAVIEMTRNSGLFARNPKIDKGAFDVVEALPSWPKPDQLANPLRRAKTLVQLLTDDSSGKAMLPDAGTKLDAVLNAKLDGLAAQHADDVKAKVTDLKQADLASSSVTTTGQKVGAKERSVLVAHSDLDRQTRRIVNSVKEGAGKSYLRYRVDKAGDDSDELEVRTEVAALFSVPGVVDALMEEADRWVGKQFEKFAATIKLKSGDTREAFARVKEMASSQEESAIELPETLRSPTMTSNKEDATPLPKFAGHLFAGADGKFPVRLNDWEREVLTTELGREDSFVAWYRNPPRAGVQSLRIGFDAGDGDWVSVQPDFVVVSKQDDGTLVASIIDPHGDHLSDAVTKLKALSAYAARFGDRFARIEAVAKGSGKELRVLDLQDPKVRAAVDAFSEPKATALYDNKSLSRRYQ